MGGAIMTTTATQERTSELRVADRCDTGGCQAQARVRATFEFKPNEGIGPVDFCLHHFNANEEAIREKALDIDDQRDRIS